MRNAWWGLAAGLVLSVAWAGGGAAFDANVEASMQVSGSLDVDDTGRVTTYAVDHRDKLPAGVVQLVDQVLPTLRFQPVVHAGQAQAVHTQMHLVVVANAVDPQHVAVHIRSARFDEANLPSDQQISVATRKSMHYPVDAMMAGVRGTVYLVVQMDRSGHVLDVKARQVNLRYVDDARGMRHWRDVLAKPAIAAARRYTFHVPPGVVPEGDGTITGTLPVTYLMDGQGLPAYGSWDSYVPGPIEPVAWLDDKVDDADNNEAIPDGTFAQAGTGLKLLTSLHGE